MQTEGYHPPEPEGHCQAHGTARRRERCALVMKNGTAGRDVRPAARV
jgi:hypothetical protein